MDHNQVGAVSQELWLRYCILTLVEADPVIKASMSSNKNMSLRLVGTAPVIRTFLNAE